MGSHQELDARERVDAVTVLNVSLITLQVLLKDLPNFFHNSQLQIWKINRNNQCVVRTINDTPKLLEIQLDRATLALATYGMR